VFAVKAGGFFAVVVGLLALIAGLFQINPIWNFGPYSPAQVSAGSQPDWYMAWTDGLLRLWPDWEINFGHRYLIPAAFFPLMGLGLVITVLLLYPFIERRLAKDFASHNLLQRPRDVPVRTSLGAMGVAFFVVATISCGNDIIADKFDISLNAMTWGGRIGLLVLPPLAYYVAYRMCIGLQRGDREVLEHGVETGIIKRLPHGAYIELHQPLGPVDEHGHPIPLEYQGAAVPKRMNKLGSAGAPGSGSFLTADPLSENDALTEAAHASEHRALTALREHQDRNGSSNGETNGHH
jgi:ubiquinol-cytochrome c reductase cytochrome b subunit